MFFGLDISLFNLSERKNSAYAIVCKVTRAWVATPGGQGVNYSARDTDTRPAISYQLMVLSAIVGPHPTINHMQMCMNACDEVTQDVSHVDYGCLTDDCGQEGLLSPWYEQE
ncbi:hypothetical protein J6590_010642 [Homalodisca vitripennis]|nr:hypothetical protein J6590_010642 [Homalodisca vitripennis]